MKKHRKIIVLVMAVGSITMYLFSSKDNIKKENVVIYKKQNKELSHTPIKVSKKKKHAKINKVFRNQNIGRVPSSRQSENKKVKATYVNIHDVIKVHKQQVIKTGNSDYFLATNFRGIRTKYYGSNLGEKVKKLGKYMIYKSSKPQTKLVVDGEHLPIVVNKYNERIGLVTGFVIVKLKSLNTYEELLRKYELSLENKYNEIKVIYAVPTKNLTDLNLLISELRIDPLVQRVELEIISNVPISN